MDIINPSKQDINKMKTDITYINKNFFITVLPNNKQAEEAVGLIINHFGSINIPLSAWDSTRHQLKKAGYSVRKQTKAQATKSNNIINNDLLGLLT